MGAGCLPPDTVMLSPIPKCKGGSGAFGARVLWSVRFAPNHGFRPQSGLVQRELYMLPAAAPHERKRTQPFYTTCGVSRAPSRPLGAPFFEPFEPFEPSEPSRPKGVSNGDTTTL